MKKEYRIVKFEPGAGEHNLKPPPDEPNKKHIKYGEWNLNSFDTVTIHESTGRLDNPYRLVIRCIALWERTVEHLRA